MVNQIHGFGSNHNWKQSLPAATDEGGSHNHIVRDIDSEFSNYTDESSHHAEGHPKRNIDGDHNDHDDASDKPSSVSSYLSSLSPTPELLHSMNMQPNAPVACMVPKHPPMGNTQARLAAFNDGDGTELGSHNTTVQGQKQYPTSDKGHREWHGNTPAEFAMQKMDNTLSSSAKGHFESSPQPQPKMPRLKLYSGKRAAINDSHGPLKKSKQVHTVRCLCH